MDAPYVRPMCMCDIPVSLTLRGQYSVPTGTDVLGDQKSVLESSEIRARNFDNVSSLLSHQLSYFKARMHQIQFRHPLGAHIAPLDPLPGCKGSYF